MTEWLMHPYLPWILFMIFVVAMLALDLGVFHRNSHKVGFKEAMTWSGVWIALAIAFSFVIRAWKGDEAFAQFLTGYVIEKSLSVDNLFVFLMVFSYFRVPDAYQHKVLFWGIIGALVMRAIFIAAGVALITKFHWMIYVFGGFLVLTGIKMLFEHGGEKDLAKNPVVRFFNRIMPVSPNFDGDRFFTVKNGKKFATPLFLALILIEFTDVVFAVDSIPAILAVTQDPFIVFTSNIFAILGLRSLYFALSGLADLFVYLKYGLSAILVFVGTKMLIMDFYKIPIGLSLAVICGILTISVVASIARRRIQEASKGTGAH